MKRLILSVATLLTLLTGGLVLAPYASAVDVLDPVCSQPTNPKPAICDDNQTDKSNPLLGPNGTLTKIAQFLTVIVGIASIVMIVIGGIKFALSTGDSSKVKSARDTIIYALIGLVVAVIAQSIIVFVLRRI